MGLHHGIPRQEVGPRLGEGSVEPLRQETLHAHLKVISGPGRDERPFMQDVAPRQDAAAEASSREDCRSRVTICDDEFAQIPTSSIAVMHQRGSSPLPNCIAVG